MLIKKIQDGATKIEIHDDYCSNENQDKINNEIIKRIEKIAHEFFQINYYTHK